MRFFLIFLSLFLYAQNFNDFLKDLNRDYKSYKVNLEKEFEEYKEILNKEFDKYKNELSKYWNYPELTTKTVFVEYSKDKKVRKKVDFKNKFIQIDVLASNKKVATQKINNALKNLIKETTKEAFFNNPVLVKVDKKFAKKGIVSKIDSKPIVGDIINLKKIKKKKLIITESKLKNYKKYSIKIPLPPKIYLIKAKSYKKEVFNKSNKFKIPPYLIYAVIHSESSYNPMARSYIPAFGLMQIVPQSAGRDVAKMLYGKPKLFTPSYLYNPSNNILLGAAYLKRLYYDYFRSVKNPLSRLYLTIAAYNTGPGNVACVFNSTNRNLKGRIICNRKKGDYSIKNASPKINSLSPKEVYNKLVNDLKYDEARNYLKKVYKRTLMYKIVIENNKL